MIDISYLSKLALGNYVYNNKAKEVATIISIDENGIRTRWEGGEDDKYHLDIDLIPITIELLYNILGLDLKLEEDELTKPYKKDKDYYDPFHMIRFTDYNVTVNGSTLWYVHVDDTSYDTKGCAELQHINEFQNFMNSIDADLYWLIKQARIQQVEEVLNDNTRVD